jgi:hypothetical protein
VNGRNVVLKEAEGFTTDTVESRRVELTGQQARDGVT